MRTVLIVDKGASAIECRFDAEVWATGAVLSEMIEDDVLDDTCTKVFCFNGEGANLAREHQIEVISRENFPDMGFDYFRSDVSYMIAYAIHEGYERIEVYGVDFDEEFDLDKPRITYWLGVAKGRGIEVDITEGSKLFRVMKENIKARYTGTRASKVPSKDPAYWDFVKAARETGDPFCFVNGIDPSAITVTSRNSEGEEVAEWRWRDGA